MLLEVDKLLLRSLLDAANSTAISHRDAPREAYALGQLEATANMAYIISSSAEEDYELENYCQSLAAYAIERLDIIAPANNTNVSKKSADSL